MEMEGISVQSTVGCFCLLVFFIFFFVGSKKENGSECSGFGSKCSFGIIKKLRVLW
jgi:hypothetical protein